jgi:hypothetical protein
MCDHDADPGQGNGRHGPVLSCAAGERTGSRRTRLWELSAECHCPVVGVCLPMPVLRRLADKVSGLRAPRDDYRLHTQVVADCRGRNPLSRLLHKELDLRHAVAVLSFRDAVSADEVGDRWEKAVAQGDIAGALWAALTHPRSDEELRERICRDVHMIQHQAGAAVRVDAARFAAVQKDLVDLRARHAELQSRHMHLIAERAREVSTFRAQLMKARADLLARDSTIAFLREDLASLQAGVPDLESRRRLKDRNDALRERLRQQAALIAALRAELAASPATGGMPFEPVDAGNDACVEEASVEAGPAEVSPLPPEALRARTVLCVGGRPGQVASYRDIVEGLGGSYRHHDGGLEQNVARLEASIAAADLVICQTGCIAHSAYWRVKDFCKRTGKPCLFIDNPSPSSMARELHKQLRRIAVANVQA